MVGMLLVGVCDGVDVLRTFFFVLDLGVSGAEDEDDDEEDADEAAEDEDAICEWWRYCERARYSMCVWKLFEAHHGCREHSGGHGSLHLI
jgi:hypothetical protein